MSAEQEKIKDLAYRLWQDAGSPHGRDQEFWFAAVAQVTAGAPVEAAPAAVKPAQAKDAAKGKAPAKAAKPAAGKGAKAKAAKSKPAKA